MISKILCIFLLLLTINSVYALEDGVSVPLVADRSTGTGKKGYSWGTGDSHKRHRTCVCRQRIPIPRLIFRARARLAAMVASDVLGIDEKGYDFIILSI